MKCRLIVIGLLVAVLLSGIIIWTPGETEAEGGENIIVTVEMDDAYGYVDVKPGSAPTTSFMGHVRASRDAGSGRIDVNLKAESSDPDFLVSVNPIQLSLESPMTSCVEITVDVVAPLGANYTDTYDYSPIVITIGGVWAEYPNGTSGQVSNSSVMVVVNQYYDVSASVEPNEVRCNSDESKRIDLWITNEGNGIDSFEISIINKSLYTRL